MRRLFTFFVTLLFCTLTGFAPVKAAAHVVGGQSAVLQTQPACEERGGQAASEQAHQHRHGAPAVCALFCALHAGVLLSSDSLTQPLVAGRSIEVSSEASLRLDAPIYAIFKPPRQLS